MRLRLLGAAAVLASAAIHLRLWDDGYRFIPTIGPLFLANVAGGVAIAVLLVAWRHWMPAVLAICFGVATLGAFTTATTIGLFGNHEIWQGRYVFGAAMVELIAIFAGAALVLMHGDEDDAPAFAPRSERVPGRHVAGV